jgi:hypothetical protein
VGIVKTNTIEPILRLKSVSRPQISLVPDQALGLDVMKRLSAHAAASLPKKQKKFCDYYKQETAKMIAAAQETGEKYFVPPIKATWKLPSFLSTGLYDVSGFSAGQYRGSTVPYMVVAQHPNVLIRLTPSSAKQFDMSMKSLYILQSNGAQICAVAGEGKDYDEDKTTRVTHLFGSSVPICKLERNKEFRVKQWSVKAGRKNSKICYVLLANAYAELIGPVATNATLHDGLEGIDISASSYTAYVKIDNSSVQSLRVEAHVVAMAQAADVPDEDDSDEAEEQEEEEEDDKDEGDEDEGDEVEEYDPGEEMPASAPTAAPSRKRKRDDKEQCSTLLADAATYFKAPLPK